MIPHDSSILHDIEHIARRQFYEDKKNGKRNDTALAFMAGSMIVIGAKILMDIWQRKNGRGR